MVLAAPPDDAVLNLLVEALPHLRGGLRSGSAKFTARLLYEHLRLDAAAVVSRDRILAFVGLGSDHHRVGRPNITTLTLRALETGEVARTSDRAEIGCPNDDCPLSSALVAPLIVRGNVVGALKLSLPRPRHHRPRRDHRSGPSTCLQRLSGACRARCSGRARHARGAGGAARPNLPTLPF